MELFLISYDTFFEGEADVINSLLSVHPLTLHLRKPGCTIHDYQRLLDTITPDHYASIMIHEHHQLLDSYDLKGIHYKSGYRKNLQHGVYTSTSCHSIEELLSLDGQFDQMFISPVFPSISKKGYSGNLNLNLLSDHLQKDHKSKIIALGGISDNKIDHLKKIGFDACAVLGAVWGENPEGGNVEKRLNKITKRL